MRLPVMITVLSARVVPEMTSITDTCVIAIGGCPRSEHAPEVKSATAVTARASRGALLARFQSPLLSATSKTCLERAGDRTRTGDVQLGKLAFYQLNYARDAATNRNAYGDSA